MASFDRIQQRQVAESLRKVKIPQPSQTSSSQQSASNQDKQYSSNQSYNGNFYINSGQYQTIQEASRESGSHEEEKILTIGDYQINSVPNSTKNANQIKNIQKQYHTHQNQQIREDQYKTQNNQKSNGSARRQLRFSNVHNQSENGSTRTKQRSPPFAEPFMVQKFSQQNKQQMKGQLNQRSFYQTYELLVEKKNQINGFSLQTEPNLPTFSNEDLFQQIHNVNNVQKPQETQSLCIQPSLTTIQSQRTASSSNAVVKAMRSLQNKNSMLSQKLQSFKQESQRKFKPVIQRNNQLERQNEDLAMLLLQRQATESQMRKQMRMLKQRIQNGENKANLGIRELQKKFKDEKERRNLLQDKINLMQKERNEIVLSVENKAREYQIKIQEIERLHQETRKKLADQLLNKDRKLQEARQINLKQSKIIEKLESNNFATSSFSNKEKKNQPIQIKAHQPRKRLVSSSSTRSSTATNNTTSLYFGGIQTNRSNPSSSRNIRGFGSKLEYDFQNSSMNKNLSNNSISNNNNTTNNNNTCNNNNNSSFQQTGKEELKKLKDNLSKAKSQNQKLKLKLRNMERQKRFIQHKHQEAQRSKSTAEIFAEQAINVNDQLVAQMGSKNLAIQRLSNQIRSLSNQKPRRQIERAQKSTRNHSSSSCSVELRKNSRCYTDRQKYLRENMHNHRGSKQNQLYYNQQPTDNKFNRKKLSREQSAPDLLLHSNLQNDANSRNRQMMSINSSIANNQNQCHSLQKQKNMHNGKHTPPLYHHNRKQQEQIDLLSYQIESHRQGSIDQEEVNKENIKCSSLKSKRQQPTKQSRETKSKGIDRRPGSSKHREVPVRDDNSSYVNKKHQNAENPIKNLDQNSKTRFNNYTRFEQAATTSTSWKSAVANGDLLNNLSNARNTNHLQSRGSFGYLNRKYEAQIIDKEPSFSTYISGDKFYSSNELRNSQNSLRRSEDLDIQFKFYNNNQHHHHHHVEDNQIYKKRESSRQGKQTKILRELRFLKEDYENLLKYSKSLRPNSMARDRTERQLNELSRKMQEKQSQLKRLRA